MVLKEGFNPTERQPTNFEQPFNTSSRKVEITAQEIELGIETTRIYEEHILRRLPWMIQKNGMVSVLPHKNTKTLEAGIESEPLRIETIDLNELKNEKISDALASALIIFKGVEDYLPDFTGGIIKRFRNSRGLTQAGYQWATEERQHGKALGIILVNTGHRTEDQINQEYYKRQEQTWEEPYRTDLEMLAYGVCQETMTASNYDLVEKRALEEDAHVTAGLAKFIRKDEIYHGAGYTKVFNVYAALDPENAKQAMLHVASTFRMPALNIMRDMRRDLVKAGKANLFLVGDEYEELVRRVVSRFDFITHEEASKAAAKCMDNLPI